MTEREKLLSELDAVCSWKQCTVDASTTMYLVDLCRRSLEQLALPELSANELVARSMERTVKILRESPLVKELPSAEKRLVG